MKTNIIQSCLMAVIAVSLGAGRVEAGLLSVTPTANATTLASAIVGTGINLVGTPTFVGGNGTPATNNLYSAGTFTTVANASPSTGIPFTSGIILTTGNVTGAPGPNNDTEFTGVLGLAGDPVLTALAGGPTFDASRLTFTFRFGDGSIGGDASFRFIFASEEYNEYVGEFNDAFTLEIDGVNRAFVPSTSTPISVNTINTGVNSAYFVDNTAGTYNLQYDGFTTVLTASALGLSAGNHTATFRIADTGDELVDAAVFIEASSFSSVPEPGTALFGLACLGVAALRRRRR